MIFKLVLVVHIITNELIYIKSFQFARKTVKYCNWMDEKKI